MPAVRQQALIMTNAENMDNDPEAMSNDRITIEEKRKVKRFNLHIESMVCIDDPERGKKAVLLRSRNISSDGVFLTTGEPLPLGSKINLGILLPQMFELERNGEKFMINASGRVVRTNEQGMAIHFDKNHRISPPR